MKFLLLIIFAFPAFSTFADVELSLGRCMARHPANGVWWQDPFPAKIDNHCTVFSFGYRFDNDWGFGYKDMGRFSSWALASASDDNYDAYRAGTEDIWDLSEWEGKGSAKAVYINKKFQYKHVYLLAGISWQETKWQMDVTGWRHESFEGTRDITVYANQKAVSWMFGIGKEIGNFGILYEAYNLDGAKDYKPMYSGVAQALNLTYRF